MSDFMLTRKQCIIAAEMGCGKTLSAFMAMVLSGIKDWIWVGTKGSLRSTAYEVNKWGLKVVPKFVSYHELKKLVENWTPGKPAPKGIIFDESHRLKNFNAQWTEAAFVITENMRKEYGDNAMIILMTGAPAPKDPGDWWSQCEIARPGFLKEGHINKFKARLSLQKESQNAIGGVYKELTTWLDNEEKCANCGVHRKEHSMVQNPKACSEWVQSVNEIKNLYKRLKGLVQVIFKKDVLKNLPIKRYNVIKCPPKPATLRAARMIVQTAHSAIDGLGSLRELSDGFQYQDSITGEVQCPRCHGTGNAEQWFDINDPEKRVFDTTDIGKLIKRQCVCDHCNGKMVINKIERTTIEVECPKDDALRDLLDLHEENGRIVIYAGFQASVDRVVEICRKEGWHVIRADGRGWFITSAGGEIIRDIDPIVMFQDAREDYPRVAFVGQPDAAGEGLTLTASFSIVFFSNSFKAGSRIQAEDRGHRPGMDLERGGMIYDLIHLPSDNRVLKNVMEKRDLQAMSLGDFKSTLAELVEDAGDRLH
jgi:SNF2 family DNA or RNA helicase